MHIYAYLGSESTAPFMSIQNLCRVPLLPRNAAKPSKGTADVPVTNCKRRSRCSLLYWQTTFQNHSTTSCPSS